MRLTSNLQVLASSVKGWRRAPNRLPASAAMRARAGAEPVILMTCSPAPKGTAAHIGAFAGMDGPEFDFGSGTVRRSEALGKMPNDFGFKGSWKLSRNIRQGRKR